MTSAAACRVTLDRRRWALQTLALMLAGCGSAPPQPREATPRRSIYWPALPEQPRFAYEATLRNAASIRDESETAVMRRLLTGDDDSKASFGKPFAVAAKGGRIYVTDTEGRRVFVFDVPRRRVFSFGFRREGELKKPAGIAVDREGRVYVVDSTARRLVVYDGLGLYLGQVDGARQWSRPTAVAVSPDGSRTFVVDTGGIDSDSHRIWIYGEQGRTLGSLGTRGSAPGQFNMPTDAAVASDGTLWVLDSGNFRVQAFDAAGAHLRSFGSVGNGLGQFARPRGMAVDAGGRVYVSDAVFCNVQVFQPDGQLLIALGSRAERDAPGRYRLPAKIAVDESGRLYVVDQYLHKIEVIRHLPDDEGRRLQAEARS